MKIQGNLFGEFDADSFIVKEGGYWLSFISCKSSKRLTDKKRGLQSIHMSDMITPRFGQTPPILDQL